MPFSNRTEAGRELAKALAFYKEQHPVILALPRGGAPVAAEIAARQISDAEVIKLLAQHPVMADLGAH